MTRAELYALVWSKPVTHVADDFGVSEAAIRKHLKRHNIPAPPRGHYARQAKGLPVVQEKLPRAGKGSPQTVDLTPRPRVPKPDPDAAVATARRQAVEREDDPKLRISVPTRRPRNLHPHALAAEKALKQRIVSDAEFAKSHPHLERRLLVYGFGKGIFQCTLGPLSIPRSVNLLHAFFHACEARGGRLVEHDKGLHIAIADCRFDCELFELVFSGSGEPAGQLRLRVELAEGTQHQGGYCRNTFPGRIHKPMEECLPGVFRFMAGAAAETRVIRAREEDHRLVEKHRERLREQEKARRDRVQRMRTFFVDTATLHENMLRLERFAAHLDTLPPSDAAGRLIGELEAALEEMRRSLSVEELDVEMADHDGRNPYWKRSFRV